MTDIFFSPHPDDIAYSCYGPICFSQNRKVIVTVYSVSCYAYNSTNNNVDETTELRKNEEKKFAQRQNAEVIFLNYADSSITMNVIPEEKKIIKVQIEKDIENLIKQYYPCNIYVPIAIGWHVDHINLRDILMLIAKTYPLLVSNFYLYEDLPYACDFSLIDYYLEIEKLKKELGIKSLVPSELNITCYSEQWQDEVKKYNSQFNDDEYKKMIAYKQRNGQYYERIWVIQN